MITVVIYRHTKGGKLGCAINHLELQRVQQINLDIPIRYIDEEKRRDMGELQAEWEL